MNISQRALVLGGACLTGALVLALALSPYGPFTDGQVSLEDARKDFLVDPTRDDLDAGRMLPAWTMDDLDRGDGEVGTLYTYLRDADLSAEAAALVLAHLDVATTDQEVTQDDVGKPFGQAGEAALTVARTYRALAEREDLSALRSTLLEEESGEAATHLAHVVSTHPFALSDSPSSLSASSPQTSERYVDGLGTVSAVPFVDERWIPPVLDLALVTDEAFAEVVAGLRYQMAVMSVASTTSADPESASSGRQVVSAQVAVARVARAVLADTDPSEREKGIRLRAMLDAVATESPSVAARLDRLDLPAPKDTALSAAAPRELGQGTDAVLEALESTDPLSLDAVAEQIVRLGTFRFVVALDGAGLLESAPDVPAWDDVSTMDPLEFETLADRWQEASPFTLNPAGSLELIRQVMED
ncbi:hypothetical protein ACHAAC_16520 [Aeromicrobium sp. CF4.19]|uniref:hypothetical protein n=1 Tax=Aeromicrobium sp. CF4.19 TaxID=3373082 RepID=UPI003EE56C85